jgi:predicted Rossmann fold flavoprotein
LTRQLPDRLPDSATTQFPNRCDVAILGAGAAGLATAIFLHRAKPARTIVLFEGANKPGAKILISGGGRCNVTNAEVTDADFNGGRRTVVRQILRAFPPAATIAFFGELGIRLHEEAGGKLFPDSSRARDVLDALLSRVAAEGVRLVAGCRVQDVARSADRFLVETTKGAVQATAIVMAMGGRSVPKTGSDGAGYAIAERLGHTIVPTTPGLAPLVLDANDRFHKELSGVSQDVELAIWANGAVSARIRGALLWTHFGVSGPAALDASRHWARARLLNQDVRMTVNFCPGSTFDDVDRRLTALAHERPKASIQSLLATLVPSSLAAAMVGELGAGSTVASQLTRDDRRRIARGLTERPLPVTDTRGYNFAEVTAGGVALEEIDASTLESRKCPGLYFVGEILDVDGRLGGFNFQWAWSTAYVAARALAKD